MGVWKESHCVFRGLVQQEDGLSPWKAAFEPHVSSLKIPVSLSSNPRTRLEPTPLLPLQALATKPQLSCAAPKVERLSFCEVLWASPFLIFPSTFTESEFWQERMGRSYASACLSCLRLQYITNFVSDTVISTFSTHHLNESYPILRGKLFHWCVRAQPLQSCLTLQCMNWSPPGSSVHGILQAKILEWVAMPSSRRSSWPCDRTHISCFAGWFFTAEPLGKPLSLVRKLKLKEVTTAKKW